MDVDRMNRYERNTQLIMLFSGLVFTFGLTLLALWILAGTGVIG